MHSAKGLASVAKCKKAVMCLKEKIPLLDKLPPATSYSDIGHELMSQQYIK